MKKKRQRRIVLLVIFASFFTVQKLLYECDPSSDFWNADSLQPRGKALEFCGQVAGHQEESGNKSGETRPSDQTIWIFPGPHKTGSTSLQAAMEQWISTNSSWSYPVPSIEKLVSLGNENRSIQVIQAGKAFTPMMTRLLSHPSWNPQTLLEQSPLLQLYRQEIQEAWSDGKNIVIATEHFDRLVMNLEQRGVTVAGDQLWQRFLCLLPSSICASRHSSIRIGIVHRTPRVDHLLSIWHHLGKSHESLPEFITKSRKPGLVTGQHSLDTMGLMEFFVKNGYPVHMIDSGMSQDLVNDAICNLLLRGLHCSTQGQPTYSPPSPNAPIRMNVRAAPGPTKLDNQTFNQIDRLFLDYDCQHLDRDVNWVHGREATFVACPHSSAKRFQRFEVTILAIVDLVCRKYSTKHCLA